MVKLRIAPGWASRASTCRRGRAIDSDIRGDIMAFI